MEKTSITSGHLRDELVIVLQITEAIGLNLAEMVYVQASLCGNKLDRDPIKTAHTTSFDCSLIWETNRQSIKRMKIENLPAKIDVYRVRNYHGDIHDATKDHIGYILLPVRAIPMLPIQKALKTKCRWTKLIGLSKEWRAHKPELLMNIMITDKEFLTTDRVKIREFQCIESKESIIFQENPSPSMMMSQKGIFIRLIQNEGLLQVGNIDTECDIFNVKLLLQDIKFLDSTLSENAENSMGREFFINYILLGNNHSRKLDRKFNRTHQIQEKISINFRTSLRALNDYFEHIFYVPIEIYLDDKMIGTVEIRLDNIIDTFVINEYLERYPNGQEYDGKVEIKTSVNLATQNKPVFEYKVIILHQGTRNLHYTELKRGVPKMSADEKAGGDCFSEKEVPAMKANESESESGKSDEIEIETVGIGRKRSNESVEVHELTPKPVEESCCRLSEIPRLFSYILQLKSVTLNKKPHKGIWQVSFFHEMADTPRTYINRDVNETEIEGNSIMFKDLELKLYFTSHTENIMDLVKSSQVCTLCLRGPHKTHAKAYLDCHSLMINTKEKTFGNILLANQNETVTALAEIFVYLEDAGLNFNARKIQTTLPEFDECNIQNMTRTVEDKKESLFDESIAYKMVDELEEWKELQQKKFLVELKHTERTYLDKLKHDFDVVKASYEDKFEEKNNELKVLTQSLEDACKQNDIQNILNEEQANKVKLDIEQSYVNRLLAIKERAKELEEDFMHELNLKNIKIEELDCNNKLLYEKVQFLTHENCDLKQNIDCLQTKYESLRTNLVPKEELENLIHEMRLLQEKFDNVLQSKNFYKEQWAKSFRECHKIRRENTCDRKDHFFTAKCDRLCDVLSDGCSPLNFDKEELDEIKFCLSLDDNL